MSKTKKYEVSVRAIARTFPGATPAKLKKLKGVFEKIREELLIKNISFKKDMLIFHTERLKVYNKAIGEYAIVFTSEVPIWFGQPADDVWHWFLIFNKTYYSLGYAHPFVEGDGDVCLGSSGEAYHRLRGKKDYYGMVEFLVQLLLSEEADNGNIGWGTWFDHRGRRSSFNLLEELRKYV